MHKSSTVKAAMISCSERRFHHISISKIAKTRQSPRMICARWRLRKFLNALVTMRCRIALTVFYITYTLFEVPSNYYLKYFGPSVRIVLFFKISYSEFEKVDKLANILYYRNGLHL